MILPKKLLLFFSSLALLTAVVLFNSFTAPAKPALKIQIQHMVGKDVLVLDKGNYKNSLGQQYTCSMLKYYVSNIHLKRNDGKDFISKEYFLVDEDEINSKTLSLSKVPDGEYTAISFIVGIDSLHNCKGIQKGALDPVKGMFWAWNTGYIFLKMEGKSPQSITSGKSLEYHIGGFQQPHNCIRTVTLSFSTPFKVGGQKENKIIIKSDLSKLFNGRTVIDFSKISTVTNIFGATTIADNYATMFSLVEAK